MSKSLRLSEKWFRRGLWLVALVFASFLVGLGGTIVGDLPKVETPLRVDDFLDKAAADKLRAEVKTARQAEQDAQTALEQAQLQRSKVRSGLRAGCSSRSAKAPTGRLCGASSSLRCLRFLWSWCLTCPATAVMCATWWALP